MTADRPTTSESLLRGVRSQDPLSWQSFVDLYGPLVFHWGKQCGLGDADAADVMQEVFVAVARSINRYTAQAGHTFRGWLWTITRNKIRDHMRLREKQVQATGGTVAQQRLAAHPQSLTDSVLEPTAPGEATRLFHRGLELVRHEFEDRTWQAFWRAVVKEEDTATIAHDLGMTPNGVRQAKSRILRRLRQQLGDT